MHAARVMTSHVVLWVGTLWPYFPPAIPTHLALGSSFAAFICIIRAEKPPPRPRADPFHQTTTTTTPHTFGPTRHNIILQPPPPPSRGLTLAFPSNASEAACHGV